MSILKLVRSLAGYGRKGGGREGWSSKEAKLIPSADLTAAELAVHQTRVEAHYMNRSNRRQGAIQTEASVVKPFLVRRRRVSSPLRRG